MTYEIKINMNNIKNKEIFIKDKYMINLIDFIYQNSEIKNVHKLTKRLFYCYNLNESEEEYNLIIQLEEHKFKELTYIYNLFCSWNPYNKYNIRQLRGFFFEQLNYIYFQSIYDNDEIITEAKVFVNGYSSHTLDLIVKSNDIFVECKFNYNSIKRDTINKMSTLKNKIPQSNAIISSYSNKNLIKDHLITLREDSSIEKYKILLNKISILSLESFQDKDLNLF